MSDKFFEIRNIHISESNPAEMVYTGELVSDTRDISVAAEINGCNCNVASLSDVRSETISGIITIPENLLEEKKYRVTLHMTDGTGRKSSVSRVVSVNKKTGTLLYFVDAVTFADDGSATVIGWALDREPVSVRFFVNDGQQEIKAEKFDRKDLLATFPEIKDTMAGFKVRLTKEEAAEFPWKITFDGADGHKAERIFTSRTSIKERWKESGGIKRVIARSYETLHEEGIRAFAYRTWFYVRTRSARAMAYQKWIERIEPGQAELSREKKLYASEKNKGLPLFSIVVPVYKTPNKYLKALIDSIEAQTYGNWELILSDAGADESGHSLNTDTILAVNDSRIRYFILKRNAGISANTNDALSHARGDWIVFADHDDTLSPDALYKVYMSIRKNPDCGYIYSDEDKINASGKRRYDPNFKPDFNPDLLRSMNYISHLSVVRKTLLDEAGNLNPDMDGSQDYDLTLRCTEKLREDQIVHIPEILYHWRSAHGSTADNQESKLYAFDAGRRAIQAHLDRIGIPGTVEELPLHGRYRIHYNWNKNPMVSVIIPNKDHISDLKRCIDSIIEKTTYPDYEIIVIENNSEGKETFDYYREIEKDERIHVVRYEGTFNYSAINNFGASYANGAFFLLLNNDTEVISPDWMREMVDIGLREDVGIVGAKLYYPDNTIQHAGVIIGLGGIAGHVFKSFPRKDPGFMGRLLVCQDYSAVTAACMLVKRDAFEKAGGLTEELAVAFNDIDFCLKVGKAGYRVVFTPFAELYHYESKSRGADDTPDKQDRFNNEITEFRNRWGEILKNGDPCYNRHFTLKRFDCSFNEDLTHE